MRGCESVSATAPASIHGPGLRGAGAGGDGGTGSSASREEILANVKHIGRKRALMRVMEEERNAAQRLILSLMPEVRESLRVMRTQTALVLVFVLMLFSAVLCFVLLCPSLLSGLYYIFAIFS